MKEESNTCFAFCSDVIHGMNGWKGPIRTGDDADKQAEKDAEEHNAEFGHSAASSCDA